MLIPFTDVKVFLVLNTRRPTKHRSGHRGESQLHEKITPSFPHTGVVFQWVCNFLSYNSVLRCVVVWIVHTSVKHSVIGCNRRFHVCSTGVHLIVFSHLQVYVAVWWEVIVVVHHLLPTFHSVGGLAVFTIPRFLCNENHGWIKCIFFLSFSTKQSCLLENVNPQKPTSANAHDRSIVMWRLPGIISPWKLVLCSSAGPQSSCMSLAYWKFCPWTGAADLSALGGKYGA